MYNSVTHVITLFSVYVDSEAGMADQINPKKFKTWRIFAHLSITPIC